MIKKTIKVTVRGGLTGETAEQLEWTVRQYLAIVQLERRDGLRMHVRTPGSAQILRIQEGDQVTIKAEGDNEKSVVDALVRLLANE